MARLEAETHLAAHLRGFRLDDRVDGRITGPGLDHRVTPYVRDPSHDGWNTLNVYADELGPDADFRPRTGPDYGPLERDRVSAERGAPVERRR